MGSRNINKREIIIVIFVLLGGAALTATSFCIYYLVKPQNTAWLILLCTVDFLYNCFTTCFIFKLSHTDKWLLKGLLVSAIYTVAFIAVAALFMLFCNAFEFLKNNIFGIVLYAFFTGPSIFIVLAILLLCLAYSWVLNALILKSIARYTSLAKIAGYLFGTKENPYKIHNNVRGWFLLYNLIRPSNPNNGVALHCCIQSYCHKGLKSSCWIQA